MGAEELLAALREEGERKARAVREKAGDTGARLRDEAALRLAQLRDGYARQQTAAIEVEERTILAEAGRAARRIRLAGAELLAERLLGVAHTLLPGLGAEDPELFGRLAGELPPRTWETLRVNPADLAHAQALFPLARIETDPGISGGMEAWAPGRELQVVNTLEKRLERAWPELLPLLLEELIDGA